MRRQCEKALVATKGGLPPQRSVLQHQPSGSQRSAFRPLLSHNVASKREKHQTCLSVLQRAEATSWNNYLQCTSCLQYNELQGLSSQGGIIEKEAPNFRLELPSKSGDDLLSHNVAGKRVKHQTCLSVLQRAEATS